MVGTVKDDTGATACNLRSGGLYFGGVGVTVPLPASVPDMGASLTNVGCCLDATPTSMQLLPSSPTDPGSSIKACTSSGAADPLYPACVGGFKNGKPCAVAGDCPAACAGGSNAGKMCTTDANCPSSTCGPPGTCTGTLPGCLFGPPLPIVSPAPFASLTTCVINAVQTTASGTFDASSGDSSVSLPLSSRVYITGNTASPCPTKCAATSKT